MQGKDIPDADKARIRKYSKQFSKKPTHQQIAKWFEDTTGRKINRSTISRFLGDRYAYLDDSKAVMKTSRIRSQKWPLLEQELENQILAIEAKGGSLREIDIITKARQIWEAIKKPGEEEPKFSNGWVHNLKRRLASKRRHESGQIASVPQNETEASFSLQGETSMSGPGSEPDFSLNVDSDTEQTLGDFEGDERNQSGDFEHSSTTSIIQNREGLESDLINMSKSPNFQRFDEDLGDSDLEIARIEEDGGRRHVQYGGDILDVDEFVEPVHQTKESQKAQVMNEADLADQEEIREMNKKRANAVGDHQGELLTHHKLISEAIEELAKYSRLVSYHHLTSTMKADISKFTAQLKKLNQELMDDS